MESIRQWADPDMAAVLERTRPSIEIRSLHNMINRYLAATMPEEARIATGGNTHIIVYLERHEGRDIFQYDIEQRFSITRSTASRVLSLMEKKGLIERRSVDYDARLRKIVLTDKARAISQTLRDNASSMEQVLLDGLDAEDVRRLLDVLGRMKNNLAATGKVGWDCARTGERPWPHPPGASQNGDVPYGDGAERTSTNTTTEEGTETL